MSGRTLLSTTQGAHELSQVAYAAHIRTASGYALQLLRDPLAQRADKFGCALTLARRIPSKGRLGRLGSRSRSLGRLFHCKRSGQRRNAGNGGGEITAAERRLDVIRAFLKGEQFVDDFSGLRHAFAGLVCCA